MNWEATFGPEVLQPPSAASDSGPAGLYGVLSKTPSTPSAPSSASAADGSSARSVSCRAARTHCDFELQLGRQVAYGHSVTCPPR